MTEYLVSKFSRTREGVIVEADSEEEAEEIALELPLKDWEEVRDDGVWVYPVEEIEVEEN